MSWCRTPAGGPSRRAAAARRARRRRFASICPRTEIDRALDPAAYLGSAEALVERALARHRSVVTVRVHHRLDGPEDAPVLVLSNSLGTTLAMWDEQAPALAERFRVLRYDQRGHGDSPAPPGPYSIADLGRDVLELLDGLGLERASFCGLSLGGMIGMWLADQRARADRPPGAVLHHRAPAAARALGGSAPPLVRAEGMEAVTDATLERWFTPARG